MLGIDQVDAESQKSGRASRIDLLTTQQIDAQRRQGDRRALLLLLFLPSPTASVRALRRTLVDPHDHMSLDAAAAGEQRRRDVQGEGDARVLERRRIEDIEGWWMADEGARGRATGAGGAGGFVALSGSLHGRFARIVVCQVWPGEEGRGGPRRWWWWCRCERSTAAQ